MGGVGKPTLKRQSSVNRFLVDPETVVMMALCEIIDHSSIHKSGEEGKEGKEGKEYC